MLSLWNSNKSKYVFCLMWLWFCGRGKTPKELHSFLLPLNIFSYIRMLLLPLFFRSFFFLLEMPFCPFPSFPIYVICMSVRRRITNKNIVCWEKSSKWDLLMDIWWRMWWHVPTNKKYFACKNIFDVNGSTEGWFYLEAAQFFGLFRNRNSAISKISVEISVPQWNFSDRLV